MKMGIRSDVGLAVKSNVLTQLTPEQHQRFFGDAVAHKDEAGTLFVWSDVKWYVDDYEEIKELYDFLDTCDKEDYILVTACSDYPEDTSDDRGRWYGNPWDLAKVVSVSLTFDA
jgi:hypothetical protein